MTPKISPNKLINYLERFLKTLKQHVVALNEIKKLMIELEELKKEKFNLLKENENLRSGVQKHFP